MGLFDLFSSPFVEVIDWTPQPGELAARRQGKATLKNGAQLTVRDGQVAVFYDEGQVAGVFGPGLHRLETSNLPILTALMNWDKGFASPYRSDLVFYLTGDQGGLTWGTSQPVLLRDGGSGSRPVRAYGRYGFRIDQVATFAPKLMGLRARITVADLEPHLRGLIAETLAGAIGSGPIGAADLAGDPAVLARQLQAAMQPGFAELGLACTDFVVESVTLPDALRAPSAPAADADPLARIERLHDLLVAGAISQADYDVKKAELLARLT